MSLSSLRTLYTLLKISTAAVFLGRAWQHLYWGAPYRSVLWDVQWMGWVVENMYGWDWQSYVTSPVVDHTISQSIKGIGLFYLFCALAAILIDKVPRLARPVLAVGGLSLLFLAFLYTKEKFYIPAQFFEYSLQFGSPFFLLAFHKQQVFTERLQWWMKVAIALTFTCHGLFAMGVFPTPGYFVEMVMNILGVDQAAAVTILKIAGILDIALSVLIFLSPVLAIPALAYAVLWGLGTTLARVLSYVHFADFQNTLMQWLHESVMRIPHFLIPLLLLLFLWQGRKRRGG